MATKAKIERYYRAIHGKRNCACCNRVIKNGEPIQVLTVSGSTYATAKQFIRLTCLAGLVDQFVEAEKEDIATEFESIRISIQRGLRYV